MANSAGTHRVLEAARRSDARVLLASTSEVYGDPEVHPQTESYWGHVNPVGPRSCYDEGKRYAEALAMAYRKKYGLDVRIARIFNTYGPRMDPADGRVISNFIVQGLRGEPLTIYGRGGQTRSFCYVSDMIRGLRSLMEAAPGVPTPMNLGNPREFTVQRTAELVARTLGVPLRVEFRPLPGGRSKAAVSQHPAGGAIPSMVSSRHFREGARENRGVLPFLGPLAVEAPPMTRKRPRSSKVGIAGLGYMGLATGLAFAAHGLSVTGYDVKPEIRESTARGVTPYQEQGLGELLRRQVRSGRFSVVDSPDALVRATEGIFICLPTPSLASGRIDLRPLRKGTTELGHALRSAKGYRLIVVKSTVVPGTTEAVVEPILRRLSRRSPRELGVAVNPEFLAEGTMVRDALHPDRVVAGTRDPRSRAWLKSVYRPFGAPSFFLTPTGAELVKYSSNAFLALKVSFANEISRMAEKLGPNVDQVMEAVGADPRIGRRFLKAGPGSGGAASRKISRPWSFGHTSSGSNSVAGRWP